MGLDFDQGLDLLFGEPPAPSRVVRRPEVALVSRHPVSVEVSTSLNSMRTQTRNYRSSSGFSYLHGSIVRISTDHKIRGRFVRVLYHVEEALILGAAINGPGGIENMVSAVLRVDLSKHEQFNVILQ